MSLHKVPGSETAPDNQGLPGPSFSLKEEEGGNTSPTQREKGDLQMNWVVVRKAAGDEGI